jgi:hypothetical protein
MIYWFFGTNTTVPSKVLFCNLLNMQYLHRRKESWNEQCFSKLSSASVSITWTQQPKKGFYHRFVAIPVTQTQIAKMDRIQVIFGLEVSKQSCTFLLRMAAEIYIKLQYDPSCKARNFLGQDVCR